MSKEHGNPRKQAMPRILISKLLVTDGLAGSHPQLLSHHNTWNFYNDYRETSTCIYVIHIISEAKHFALQHGDLLFYAFTHVECTRDDCAYTERTDKSFMPITLKHVSSLWVSSRVEQLYTLSVYITPYHLDSISHTILQSTSFQSFCPNHAPFIHTTLLFHASTNFLCQ
jgi:hypothetical protein